MSPAAGASSTHPALSANLASPTSASTNANEAGLMSSLNPPPPQQSQPPPPIVDLTQIENYAMGSCEDPYSSMNLLNH